MSVTVENRESAYALRIQTYAIVNHDHTDLESFFCDAYSKFCVKQEEVLESYRFMKTYSTFCGIIKKSIANSDGDFEEVRQELYLSCGAQKITGETNLEEWFDNYIIQITQPKVEEFETNGSGWIFAGIKELIINNTICFVDHRIFHYQSIFKKKELLLTCKICRMKSVLCGQYFLHYIQ
jgi:hypothetical protein